MPGAAGDAVLHLVWGDDDYGVQRKARQVFDAWTAGGAGMDSEVIDAAASSAEDARRAVARLHEALQTLPFFGGPKCVWFRNCTFIGHDLRTSESASVQEAVAGLAESLSGLPWKEIRLLISAPKVDRRRTFYKTIDKLEFAEISHFPGLSGDDRDWQVRAESMVARELKELGKKASADVLARFAEWVGPNAQVLASEALKVATYLGERSEVTSEDVETIVTRGRHARAFALGDALGDRNLPLALRCLEDELWAMQADRQRSAIGIVYSLIAKVRAMLLTRALFEEKLLRPGGSYPQFLAQLKQLPPERLPTDKRYNPVQIAAYVLYRAGTQTFNYTVPELVGALDELMRCNLRLVGSSLDTSVVLQLALTRIIGRPPAGARGTPARERGAAMIGRP